MRNEQHVDWQKQIDLRVQDAIANKQKLLLEDLVKDPYLELPAQEAQEQIKFICNNTGK